jgi:cytochrome c553
MKNFILFFTLLLLSNPQILQADAGTDFFEKKIRPALKTYCYRCHSDEEKKIRGGLLVDTKMGLLNGGDSGAAIVPNSLSKSLLWASINYENDLEMPPKKAMPAEVIADFKKWILMGAPDPRNKKSILVKSSVSPADIKKGKDFWAFKKPVYTKPKPVKGSWGKTPIDSYVANGLIAAKMRPAVETDAYTLARRLYTDIIGLPPKPEQAKIFAQAYKTNPTLAIDKLVDNLLASKHYGERWGRHWLDVARFAESAGREINATYPNAWRYRDYVIKSFNDDKPYDFFIQQQIAGDLLKAKTDEQWAENLIATSFLALGPKTLSDQDARQFKADLIDEQIDATTRGILGISVACARCHDHKFDPIPQADYYALAGIFLSSKTYYGTIKTVQNRHQTSLIKLPVRDKSPLGSEMSTTQIADLKKSLSESETKIRELRGQRRQSMGNDGQGAASITRSLRQQERIAEQIKEKLYSVDEKGKPMSYCMGMQPGPVVKANIFERGEVSKPGQKIERGFIQVMSDRAIKIPSTANGRKELALWMTSEDHPLTAKVMVNRIWMKLMGSGLVRTPENFGTTGQAPTHPELLDYLALRFMKNNWSVKSLIKDIVSTKTYRMSSKHDAVNFRKDPDNKLLWRVSPRRFEAEVIRDSVLQASGKLNTQAPVGSIVAEQGHTIANIATRGSAVSPYEGNSLYRSVYLPVVRDMLPSMLKAFDFTESMMTSSQREQNNTSAQALYMLNNSFILIHSDNMAKRIVAKNKSTDERLKQAFLLCYNRPPSYSELGSAKNLYSSFKRSKEMKAKQAATQEFVALSAVCQALVASAEFRYRN